MRSNQSVTQYPSHPNDPIASAEAALKAILRSAPQDLWLETVRRSKRGVHDGLVSWMLNQPECDFAIAIHAFYHSDPTYHLDNPRPLPSQPNPSQIFALVLLNWDKGYYRQHDLCVEQRDAHPRVVASVRQKLMARPKGSLPFHVPDRFLYLQGGEQVSLPAHLSPADDGHLWALYNSLGLAVPNSAPGLARRIDRARRTINNIGFRRKRT